MSMSAVLVAVRTRLRNVAPTYGMRDNSIRIEPDGTPPPKATGSYICLDESNVEVLPGMEEGLQEIFSISVWCCRQADMVSPERLGDMLEPYDRYLASIVTLERMERMVIQSLHGSWVVKELANGLAGFPGTEELQGDVFQSPLFYTGRGPMDTFEPDSAAGYEPQSGWRRRELRFRGMLRTQRLEAIR